MGNVFTAMNLIKLEIFVATEIAFSHAKLLRHTQAMHRFDCQSSDYHTHKFIYSEWKFWSGGELEQETKELENFQNKIQKNIVLKVILNKNIILCALTFETDFSLEIGSSLKFWMYTRCH